MRFLVGKDLTAAIKRVTDGTNLRMAVAYWGQDAIKLLGLDPTRSDIRVLCCLKGGKSDPDIIQQFEERARQHDTLHAKVYWSSEGSVVGSANASSNGMPEEEDASAGLLEAGVLVEERAALVRIREWFDELFEKIYGSELA